MIPSGTVCFFVEGAYYKEPIKTPVVYVAPDTDDDTCSVVVMQGRQVRVLTAALEDAEGQRLSAQKISRGNCSSGFIGRKRAYARKGHEAAEAV